MMKSIQPSPQLPGLSASRGPTAMNTGMPARSSKTAARNLTGIYLGSESGAKSMNNSSRAKHAVVPPLARSRGTRRAKTPIEERRYLYIDHIDSASPEVDMDILCTLPFCTHNLSIPCLPAMPQSRYPVVTSPQRLDQICIVGFERQGKGYSRMVELHRIKEDKQGFTGQILKRRSPSAQQLDVSNLQPPRTAPAQPAVLSQSPVAQGYNDFWDLTRQTQRQFTAANNSGVTHLENLNIQPEDQASRAALQQELAASLARQVRSLAASKQEVEGLAQCYRKVCKGNVEALYSLLPLKKQIDAHKKHAQRYTGFAVKSYRNPNQAQIVANFPSPEARPRTTLGNVQRPFVPSPYFFKHYNPPRTAATGRPMQDRYPLSYADQILPAPGAGTLSRSLNRAREQSADIRANTPVDHSARDLPLEDLATEGDQPKTRDSENKVKIPHPEVDEQNKPSKPQSQQATEDQQDANNSNNALSANMADVETEIPQRERINSGTDIMIGLVDESGANAPVEIDETDEEIKGTVPEPENTEVDEEPPAAPTLNRRVSITERILKTKNSEQQMQKLVEESAKKRKQELANLLDEHETIIAEIATMETPGSGDENENQPPEASLENGK